MLASLRFLVCLHGVSNDMGEAFRESPLVAQDRGKVFREYGLEIHAIWVDAHTREFHRFSTASFKCMVSNFGGGRLAKVLIWLIMALSGPLHASPPS